VIEELWSDADAERIPRFLAPLERGQIVRPLIVIEGGGPAQIAETEALLDSWAKRLAPRLVPGDAAKNAHELATFLGNELGFRGDEDDYYSVSNVLLSKVLKRRRGLPILLAVIWMEVGARAGVPVAGIGMPGHFIARVGGPNGVYVDPFTGGRRLSVDECRQIVERLSDSNVTWSDDFLAQSTPDQILERVLQNLFGGYSRVGDTAGQYRTATFLSALRPDSAERLFQRAQSAEATGAFELARSLYNEVLERFPEASEAEQAGEALMKDNEEPTVN